MTRRAARKKSGGVGLRAALLVVAAVALGAGVTWALRGCRTPEKPSAPRVLTPPRPTATAAPRRGRAAAMPPDFESVGRPGNGVVALVLDDLGYDERALETLSTWNVPLAIAAIPSAPFAGRAVRLAKEKGWDLLVHLPMEPEAGPSEAEAVGGRDGDDAIRSRVADAIARTPGAIGVNNHQGSRATADARVVRAVLGVVKERGLFFLDSRTTTASVAGTEAAALGVPFLSRDVFLDDVAAEAHAAGGAPEALDAAWARALQLAGKKGDAIVIGHPRRETLAFLEKRLASEKAAGARLVKISELVP